MTTHEPAAGDVGSLFPVPDESALPERLSTWFEHFRALHEPTDNLGTADREMIAVVVSAANRCLYCLVAHGAALREALGDPVLGERIAFDWRRRASTSAARRSAPTPRRSRCTRRSSARPTCAASSRSA